MLSKKIRLLETVPTVNVLIFEPCTNIMAQQIPKFIFFPLFKLSFLFKVLILLFSPKLSTKFSSRCCRSDIKFLLKTVEAFLLTYLGDGGRSKILP